LKYSLPVFSTQIL